MDVEAPRNSRDKWIGVYIGALAVMLALATMGGDNAAKEATLRNIEAANLWAFFQSRNARRTSYQLAGDQLEVVMAANPGWSPETRGAVEAKVKAYREQVAALTSDKKRNEGLDELFERARSAEARRDLALRRDPYFDYAQATLQIGIVLASVAIISGGNFLLGVSMVLGALGTAFCANGFLLIAAIPLVE